jgi:hypothetical protein
MKILNQEVQKEVDLNVKTGIDSQHVPAQAGKFDESSYCVDVRKDAVQESAEHKIF